MKALQFVGSSQQDLAAFPESAKRQAGFELWQVQLGLMPGDFKPMPTVGAGAYEVRIKVGTQWRVIYVASRGGCGVCTARLSEDHPKDSQTRY